MDDRDAEEPGPVVDPDGTETDPPDAEAGGPDDGPADAAAPGRWSQATDAVPARPRALAVGPAVDAVPGVARIAASTLWHTTEWSVATSWRLGGRVLRSLGDRREAQSLVHDVNETSRAVAGLARAVSAGIPLPRAVADLAASVGARVDAVTPTPPSRRDPRPDSALPGTPNPPGRLGAATPSAAALRARGARLLERSRDVWDDDAGHPAYERILDELAPDEARVLLLLLEGGPQPSVDVRTGGPVGLVSSHLVAPGLTMIGARAGCRYLDQVPAYMNNLFRLGMVWFSRESLRDPMEYQVVEAQPDVLEAMHSVRFAKVVRRSIHLTPFGEDFCKTCLVDETLAEAEFPAHALPPEGDAAEPPSAT